MRWATIVGPSWVGFYRRTIKNKNCSYTRNSKKKQSPSKLKKWTFHFFYTGFIKGKQQRHRNITVSKSLTAQHTNMTSSVWCSNICREDHQGSPSYLGQDIRTQNFLTNGMERGVLKSTHSFVFVKQTADHEAMEAEMGMPGRMGPAGQRGKRVHYWQQG